LKDLNARYIGAGGHCSQAVESGPHHRIMFVILSSHLFIFLKFLLISSLAYMCFISIPFAFIVDFRPESVFVNVAFHGTVVHVWVIDG
jgi:hypothetical protein